MKTKPFLIVSLVLALALLLVTPASALFIPSNGQAATLVLGQPDFTSSGAALGLKGMHGPSRVAVDPTTGKVFVADTGNNRVLRFSSVTALGNGAAAEAVLGQPNFATSSSQTTQDGMSSPIGVAVDIGGRLWVSDDNNSRVLRFDNAATKADGANADGVLGEPDFASRHDFCNTTASLMCFPQGLAVDGSGRLWVADAENHRVLRFDNAAAKSNGAAADGELGEPDFTTRDCLLNQGGMCDNYGVAVDASGRLWVTDLEWMRVLRFDNAAAKPNGAYADGVLGQPDFTTTAKNCSQDGMNHPIDAAVDSSGRLYVAELYNSRVLVFDAAASLPNGANASSVLGQPDFGTPGFDTCPVNNGGISAATLAEAAGVSFDPAAKVLWVADGGNNRVLMYGQPYRKVHILPFIGLIVRFLPPGTTVEGVMAIRTRDGSIQTLLLPPNVRIRPASRAGSLGVGSFVTLLARQDRSSGQWIAVRIIVHARAPALESNGQLPLP